MKKQTLVIILIAMLVVSCLALTACHSCEFGEWTVVSNATCTDAGLKERICECGEKQTEVIPALGHSYESTVIAPTCTAQGYTLNKCLACGDTHKDNFIESNVTHDFLWSDSCNNCGESIADASVENEDISNSSADCVMYYIIPIDDDSCDVYIRGNGTTKHLYNSHGSPFSNSKYKLRNIYIAKGITSLSNYTFSHCETIEKVVFQDESALLSVGTRAFEYCYNLQSIQFPSSLKSLGWHALSNCTNLTEVTFGQDSQLTSLDTGVFHSCEKLENISLPEGLARISDSLFAYCTSLKEIVIPSGVNSIGGMAFKNCSSLTNVTIPESVVTIKHSAFEHCSSLTNITLPQDLRKIELSSFSGCSGLLGIIIPSSVKEIGGGAFRKCKNLTSVVFEENSEVNLIDSYAFAFCEKLSEIIIPKSVLEIHADAFNSCTNLSNVVFEPASKLKSLSWRVFANCTSLESITIPQSVTYIGESVFEDCTSLSNITILGSPRTHSTFLDNTAYYNDRANWSDWVLYLGDLLVQAESIITSCEVKPGTKVIADYAFSDCKYLVSIVIPESVVEIYNVFQDCTKLKDISILGSPAFGAEEFSSTAFYKDESNWTDGVLYINNCLVKVKDIVGSYTIMDGTTVIADGAFRDCREITSVVIPTSIVSIGSGAFYSCYNLEEINYAGTAEQWETIPKGAKWDYGIRNYCINFNYEGELQDQSKQQL